MTALRKAKTSSITESSGLANPAVVAVLTPRTVAFVACAPNAAVPAMTEARITAPCGRRSDTAAHATTAPAAGRMNV